MRIDWDGVLRNAGIELPGYREAADAVRLSREELHQAAAEALVLKQQKDKEKLLRQAHTSRRKRKKYL